MKKIAKAVGPFKLEVAQLRIALAEEDDEMERRSLAAKIGGVKRRWCTVLIGLLTDEAFKDGSVSREKVREWQQETFGQAVASGKLSAYATPTRDGGGRSDFAAPSAMVAAQMKKLFKDHRDDCLGIEMARKGKAS